MNSRYEFFLKGMRKIVAKQLLHALDIPKREMNPDKANELIYNLLVNDKPCMIARYGSMELDEVISYIGYKCHKGNAWGYILGRTPYWWNFNISNQSPMQYNAGFFPIELSYLEQFAELVINDSGQIDLLGSWRYEENYMKKYLKSDIQRVALILLEPFWSNKPWSRALKGKKVLVIHPFNELIESQYAQREYLFPNLDVLPDFELKTIKAVQSIEGCSEFATWFEALEYMERQMDNIDYDICLIGAGAYGMPLAAYAKRQGKKAVHLGGALQLLFGIRGKRWDDPNYGAVTLKRSGCYLELFNEHWVYPGNEYKPSSTQCCDDNCYWQ